MILIICSAACIAVFGACKVDIVGYHFHSGAVVAVLILILAGLKTAFNGDQTALLEILTLAFVPLQFERTIPLVPLAT